ncbi:hypothetical protein LJB90_03480 [Eubacteriales bacterium OttesenSCG-928-G02]|nr:hypothetical protein [Eubacteriales bacterium OttesenSCG-928-G02]
MKKIIILILITAIAFSSCSFSSGEKIIGILDDDNNISYTIPKGLEFKHDKTRIIIAESEEKINTIVYIIDAVIKKLEDGDTYDKIYNEFITDNKSIENIKKATNFLTFADYIENSTKGIFIYIDPSFEYYLTATYYTEDIDFKFIEQFARSIKIYKNK